MHLLQAILMGTVQGLSEFLPISSSAHLVFTSNFYKVFKRIEITQVTEQEIFFDIMLHLGTLIAVLIFFRKDLLNIAKAFWFGLTKKEYENYDFKIGCYIILGTIMTAIVAIPLCEISEKLVFMPSFAKRHLVISKPFITSQRSINSLRSSYWSSIQSILYLFMRVIFWEHYSYCSGIL